MTALVELKQSQCPLAQALNIMILATYPSFSTWK